MNKIRYQFRRTEECRFLSHLDQQRLFQRALRRAGMNPVYSQGFNPHPKMSFALALSVGMTSDCEYGEVTLKDDISCDDFIFRLNKNLPKGLTIIKAYKSQKNTTSLTASLIQSEYIVDVPLMKIVGEKELKELFEQYLLKDSAIIKKRNKKGKFNDKEIRPYIQKIELISLSSDNNTAKIGMKLCFINQMSVKPETVLTSVNNEITPIFDINPGILIHRKNLI